MRLLVRRGDGTLRRPVPTYSSPDFSGANDGALLIEDGDALFDLGINVVAGDDTDPPTHFSYEASLYALNDRLVVSTTMRRSSSSRLLNASGDELALRISEDSGRTWRVIEFAPALDEWRLVDRVDAG
jgi:hypothetical protein